jgi:hypothetical protein
MAVRVLKLSGEKIPQYLRGPNVKEVWVVLVNGEPVEYFLSETMAFSLKDQFEHIERESEPEQEPGQGANSSRAFIRCLTSRNSARAPGFLVWLAHLDTTRLESIHGLCRTPAVPWRMFNLPSITRSPHTEQPPHCTGVSRGAMTD